MAVLPDEPRWLNEGEHEAWVGFVGLLLKLPQALDSSMRRRTGWNRGSSAGQAAPAATGTTIPLHAPTLTTTQASAQRDIPITPIVQDAGRLRIRSIAHYPGGPGNVSRSYARRQTTESAVSRA